MPWHRSRRDSLISDGKSVWRVPVLRLGDSFDDAYFLETVTDSGVKNALATAPTGCSVNGRGGDDGDAAIGGLTSSPRGKSSVNGVGSSSSHGGPGDGCSDASTREVSKGGSAGRDRIAAEENSGFVSVGATLTCVGNESANGACSPSVECASTSTVEEHRALREEGGVPASEAPIPVASQAKGEAEALASVRVNGDDRGRSDRGNEEAGRDGRDEEANIALLPDRCTSGPQPPALKRPRSEENA